MNPTKAKTSQIVCGCDQQQGVSGRISARMSAIERTHNEFRQKFFDLLQNTNQNQQVLKNLSTMFSIMMEKIRNPMTVGEPQSPTAQNTNSQMPTFDRMLNSVCDAKFATLVCEGVTGSYHFNDLITLLACFLPLPVISCFLLFYQSPNPYFALNSSDLLILFCLMIK